MVEELRKEVRQLANSVKGDPRLSSLLKLHATLNALEDRCGFEPTDLAEYFGINAIIAVPVARPS